MFGRLGTAIVRFRRAALALTVLFVAAAGVVGAPGVFGVLQGGGFEDPSSESTKASELLQQRFAGGQPNLVVLLTSSGATVDDPGVVEAGNAVAARLAAAEGVGQVVSYWSLGSPPPLRSVDGDRALVLAQLPGDDDQVEATIDRLGEELGDEQGGLTIELGGEDAVFASISTQVEQDLAKAESIAVPLTLVLLVLVFGSVVAALLPLAVGAIAVLGTFLVLYGIGSVTDVSIFSINLATALGLGLAIDYSLFIVSRFREELRNGLEPHDAVVRTVDTAGRTIVFSAVTVAVSLAALLMFPLYFLRSFAYSGIAVVLLAMLASLVSLPALLAVIGRGVDSLRLFHRDPKPEGTGFWYRIAHRVMRRPVQIGTGVVVLLVIVGLPFFGVVFGLPDDRVLPESVEARRVSDTLRDEFASNESESFPVLIPDTGNGPVDSDRADIAELAADLSAVQRRGQGGRRDRQLHRWPAGTPARRDVSAVR